MDLRLRFVSDWLTGCWTMTELCGDFQISRKTGYKWVARYDTHGRLGLQNASRRPHHSPRATPAAVREALVALRRQHPHWGARKLLVVAARQEPNGAWPSRSTVCDLLKAQGLVSPRRRRLGGRAAPRAPLAPITAPNEVWTADFKGEFRTGDGRYCYPLTVRDGWSRFLVGCEALLTRSFAATQAGLARTFAAYGLPERIRTDNGSPFASTGLAGLSRLAVWWIRLGIVPERIAPGRPDQNGSHEQFHAVLKAETARPPAATATAQQRRFDHWRPEYNDERPHEALADAVPASRYHPSPRPLPARLPPLEYPGALEVRRVSTPGCVSWRGRALFVSEALVGQDVAFEEIDDGLWTVRLATVVLARFDERSHRIHPIAAVKVGRSASSAGSAPHTKTR